MVKTKRQNGQPSLAGVKGTHYPVPPKLLRGQKVDKPKLSPVAEALLKPEPPEYEALLNQLLDELFIEWTEV